MEKRVVDNGRSKENGAGDILASQYLFDLPVYTRNTASTVTWKLNDRPNMLQNETWDRRRLRLVLDCSQPLYLRWEQVGVCERTQQEVSFPSPYQVKSFKFCAGAQFSSDSIRAFNDGIKKTTKKRAANSLTRPGTRSS